MHVRNCHWLYNDWMIPGHSYLGSQIDSILEDRVVDGAQLLRYGRDCVTRVCAFVAGSVYAVFPVNGGKAYVGNKLTMFGEKLFGWFGGWNLYRVAADKGVCMVT